MKTRTRTKKLWTTAIVAIFLAIFIGGCKDENKSTVGVCPLVIATSPTNAALGVPLDQVITVTFNEKMNPVTFTKASFTLLGAPSVGITKNGNGTSTKGALAIKKIASVVTGTVSFSGVTATFKPDSALSSNTTYTGRITTAVKDLQGNILQVDYVWNFSTGASLAPTVISTDPADSATGVFLNKTVNATFSVPMDTSTITSSTFTLKTGTTAVTGVVTYSGTTATFTPSAKLTSGTTYTATITSGAKNISGTILANNYVWIFTTGTVTAPTVVSIDPVNLATNVALTKVIAATFSVPMDPLTITSSTFTVKTGATVVAGAVSYSGSTATFTPSSSLATGNTYTVTITTGAKNVAGTPLVNNYISTFSTGATILPTVVSTDPTNVATNVALNKIVTATFSVPMDASTITTSTFTLKAGATSVTGVVNYAGSTATFTPSTTLVSGTTYTATITTGAKNVPGSALAANYVWTFSTGAVIVPTVLSTDPLNSASGVALNKVVSATFSVPMDGSTFTTSTFTLKAGATAITGTVLYSGSTATFTPSSNLLSGTTYTATITTGAKNVSGTALASNYVWTFTTVIVTAPTVTVTDPLNLATSVALNKIVSATFSVPMDAATLTTSTFTLKAGATVIAGAVSYSGSTATFTPTSILSNSTTYTATITTGAKNVPGTPLASDYVWSFTTLAGTPPTVLSTDPLDLATGVALNKLISATFSVPMDASTITSSSFTLKLGTVSVAGAVGYSGSTATFTPTALLISDSTYTATITTLAKNAGGTALASNYVWKFSTVAHLGPVAPPLGSASIFGAFGGNAGITNQGINTIINGSISTTAASTLVTGFHDGTTADVYTETPLNIGDVTGRIYTAPPVPGTATSAAIATAGLADATTAYNDISPASMPGGSDPGAGELGGLTLAPGIYKSAGATFDITNGPLTLDAQGDVNAVWVFQTAAGLTVGIAGPTGARSVVLINGASAKNVFWHVGSSATINGAGGGIMVGTIIANSGVTFSTAGNVVQTVLNGRAISLISSVTMVNTTITVP